MHSTQKTSIMAFPRNNQIGSSNSSTTQNHNMIPLPNTSNTMMHLPMPNYIIPSHHDSPLIHIQRVVQNRVPPAGILMHPAVRAGLEDHLFHVSSVIAAYRGVPVFPTRPVNLTMRYNQSRRPPHFPANIRNPTLSGFTGRGLQHLMRGTHVPSNPVQPTQTYPTLPNSNLNLNPTRFQPALRAPHYFPHNNNINIAKTTALSNPLHNRTSTRFRSSPPPFSSNFNNIGIRPAMIMSSNQASTSSQAQFVPNTNAPKPSTSSSRIKAEPQDDQEQPRVARERTTTTTAATSSQPPQGQHTCIECGKSFASGSALGGHMSSHARKRKLEAARSGKRFKPEHSLFDYIYSLGFEKGSSSRAAANPSTVSTSTPTRGASTSGVSKNVGAEEMEAPSAGQEDETPKILDDAQGDDGHNSS